MYITLEKALEEINSNNYSTIKIFGFIELTLFYSSITSFIDNDMLCLYDSDNHCLKLNRYQIMKVIKESDMITIELDNFIKLNIL